MSKKTPPSPLPANEYEAIESALLESVRGRWFLAEFSRRNRTADTQVLLDAITKLESALIQPKTRPPEDWIRHEIIEMSEAISRTRREIAAGPAGSLLVAGEDEIWGSSQFNGEDICYVSRSADGGFSMPEFVGFDGGGYGFVEAPAGASHPDGACVIAGAMSLLPLDFQCCPLRIRGSLLHNGNNCLNADTKC